MTDERVRKAANALLDRIDGCLKGKEAMIYIASWDEYKALKASLTPSREERIAWLEKTKTELYHAEYPEDVHMINDIIAELRKGESK